MSSGAMPRPVSVMRISTFSGPAALHTVTLPPGEQASIAAKSSVGGNWLYGGSNNQIVLQATQIQDSRNAGYNLAYGIAEMSLSIGN